ncbi:hypothetical protein L579_3072 [Pantoea sp. AS-PWVM4]|nr:hypothetical protein L579_3072 [Pantoea sp. AS-PWVM4]
MDGIFDPRVMEICATIVIGRKVKGFNAAMLSVKSRAA